MTDTLFFPTSSTAVEIDIDAAHVLFHHYAAEEHKVSGLFATLALPDLVTLAKAVLDAQAAGDYDQFLIAQYEAKQDARIDAVRAEWGHD